MPFRRDVTWLPATDVFIQPLLNVLELSAGTRHWGYQFRYGIFSISDHDMRIIAGAMGAEIPEGNG